MKKTTSIAFLTLTILTLNNLVLSIPLHDHPNPYRTNKHITKRALSTFGEERYNNEKELTPQKLAVNIQQNQNTENTKSYVCKFKSNETSRYDAVYYTFVKNAQNGMYSIKNSKVIHGFYGDIHVNNATDDDNVEEQEFNIENTPPSAIEPNSQQYNSYTTITPKSTGPSAQKSPYTTEKSNNGHDLDKNGVIEYKIHKKEHIPDCNIMNGNSCPEGQIRDPSNLFCIDVIAIPEDYFDYV